MLLQFISDRKWFVALLVISYSAAILLLHDTFVNISVALMNKFSLPNYNVLVRNIFVAVGGAALLFLLVNCFKHPERTKVVSYLLLFSFLLIAHSLFLLEMNIEIIHTIEYSVLALLMFFFTERFGAALVFSIPVMLLDEWLQYEVLYPNYSLYYEFNDIVLDVLGCALALTALKIFLPTNESKNASLTSRNEFIFLTSLTVIFFLLYATCFFSRHTETMCSNTIFNLSRLDNYDSFWHIHHFTKAKYHVLSPTSGVLIIFFLCLLLMGLDGYSSTAKTSPSKTV